MRTLARSSSLRFAPSITRFSLASQASSRCSKPFFQTFTPKEPTIPLKPCQSAPLPRVWASALLSSAIQRITPHAIFLNPFARLRMAEPRFLVLRLGSLGDIVHTFPAVSALRETFPSAEIVWLTHPRWKFLVESSGLASDDRTIVPREMSSLRRAVDSVRQSR